MADDALSRLRSTYKPADGLSMHDWGDSAAVVFVPGTASTHLLNGGIASVIADWGHQHVSGHALEQAALDELAAQLEVQMPALLQTGIFVLRNS